MNPEKSALEQLEDMLKEFWRQLARPSIIAARHAEFLIEPKIFIGDKLHPEILKLLTLNYLANTSRQDSGTGNNIEVSTEKIVIKNQKGKPVVIIRDQEIVQQFLAQQA
ncbi:hypothetical protein COT42_07160 [Candidatus Saganbacteria bacterium CG08_land_8_20_14_0_20_45_16]|uniref:Uncharacterized protein n=1 Tax=Candidatus Saganbacteria bacterium CG08_land_8_20_14_0_20_45_16 TaxID=2014293 RepID=A0A2H0XVB4_UNCSA|nr:MAG: hypothetical protein COT42_07160 [Candidatus Saganbacteria bacterium CG08_land_8_20_14_0_20_45_16]